MTEYKYLRNPIMGLTALIRFSCTHRPTMPLHRVFHKGRWVPSTSLRLIILNQQDPKTWYDSHYGSDMEDLTIAMNFEKPFPTPVKSEDDTESSIDKLMMTWAKNPKCRFCNFRFLVCWELLVQIYLPPSEGYHLVKENIRDCGHSFF